MRNACQFSFACDGIPERVTDAKSWTQAEEIAKGVVDGKLYLTEVGKATHYHATYVYPRLGAAHEEGDQDRPSHLLPVQARLAVRLSRRLSSRAPPSRTQLRTSCASAGM